MEKELIAEIKKKKEFSQLPDSVVARAGEKSGWDVKKARAILRKYFGVFLSNKILGGKLDAEEVLKKHLSTRNRDYVKLYKRIFEGNKIRSVVDLGCGVNGFSYGFMPNSVNYAGIEAAGQLVGQMNNYFKDKGFEDAQAVQGDLFDLCFVLKILKKQKKPRVVFMFQIVDALEFFKKDFSKKFLLEISRECEKIVLSFSLKSLSGKTRFKVSRGWLLDFLRKEFEIVDEFEIGDERFLVLKKRKL